LVLDNMARPRFSLRTPWGSTEVALPMSGIHMAINAAAAAAAGLVVDVPLEAVAPALSRATLSPWRMEMLRTTRGALVLNDAYNANPASMRAALATLVALPASRRVAVLGLMAELDDAEAEHRRIGEEVRAADIELIAVGTSWYGPDPVDDPVAAVGELAPDAAVLVKGSRVAGLERLAAVLASN
jgi:UDP-N-acetylmuramoyl-tripeptide--D-alanyl-D-alanine ligase